MGAGKGKSRRVQSQSATGQRQSLYGIEVITGADLGAQRHTVSTKSKEAPSAKLYQPMNDALFVDCLPFGGFWTEVYDPDYCFWDLTRTDHTGESCRLVPHPETKILAVDTIKKAEKLFANCKAGALASWSDDQPFTVSLERLRDKGMDGIWVTDEVAAQTPIFDGWDASSVFWFSEEWPFAGRVRPVGLPSRPKRW